MAIFFYFRNSISRCHEVNDLTAARMPSCTPIPVRRGVSGCAWRVMLGTRKPVGEASGKSPAPTAKPLHPDPGRGPERQRGRSVGAGGQPCRIGEAPGGPPRRVRATLTPAAAATPRDRALRLAERGSSSSPREVGSPPGVCGCRVRPPWATSAARGPPSRSEPSARRPELSPAAAWRPQQADVWLLHADTSSSGRKSL